MKLSRIHPPGTLEMCENISLLIMNINLLLPQEEN